MLCVLLYAYKTYSHEKKLVTHPTVSLENKTSVEFFMFDELERYMWYM